MPFVSSPMDPAMSAGANGGPGHALSPVPGMPGKKDPNIKVTLENEDLWKEFHEIGTEMIITKMGRSVQTNNFKKSKNSIKVCSIAPTLGKLGAFVQYKKLRKLCPWIKKPQDYVHEKQINASVIYPSSSLQYITLTSMVLLCNIKS
jgi:hypothetical protein